MGSANSYDENTSPARSDMLLGIDDPSGSWSIKRFEIEDIFGLLAVGDIPEAITVSASGSVADGALSATLQIYAGISPAANVQAILGAADYAAIRALLDLEAGTDFYSISAANAAFEPAGVTESDISDLGTTVTLNADTDVSGNSWVVNEDDMSSDSDTKVPLQGNVVAYIAALKLDDLASPDDNTDLDVSITAHGLCPKAPNDTEKFLRGDGSWEAVPFEDYVLTVVIDDISTAGSIYIPAPIAGDIVLIQSVIQGAITTADCTLTASIGGTNITNGVITIGYSGAAAGDYDSCSPTGNNTVAIGSVIRIISDGGSTGAVSAIINIVIER